MNFLPPPGPACFATDGNDGAASCAGAWWSSDLHGVDGLGERLEGFDTAGWFRGTGGLLVTGGTGTNVADLVVVVNEGRKEEG